MKKQAAASRVAVAWRRGWRRRRRHEAYVQTLQPRSC